MIIRILSIAMMDKVDIEEKYLGKEDVEEDEVVLG